MKITDPDIIKNGEKDLIDAVKEDIDLDAVNEILKERLVASGLLAKGGEIVVHNNKIAFRIDFDVQLSGSLMFDRQGNYIADEMQAATHSDDSGTDLEPSAKAIEETAGPGAVDDDGELDINLPEYSLDDEPPASDDQNDEAATAGEEESYDSDDLFEKELEEEFSRDSNPLETADAPEQAERLQSNDEQKPGEDDDMDDILKESRDFWEQKKDS